MTPDKNGLLDFPVKRGLFNFVRFCRIDVCLDLRLIDHHQIEVAGVCRRNGQTGNNLGLIIVKTLLP